MLVWSKEKVTNVFRLLSDAMFGIEAEMTASEGGGFGLLEAHVCLLNG